MAGDWVNFQPAIWVKNIPALTIFDANKYFPSVEISEKIFKVNESIYELSNKVQDKEGQSNIKEAVFSKKKDEDLMHLHMEEIRLERTINGINITDEYKENAKKRLEIVKEKLKNLIQEAV